LEKTAFGEIPERHKKKEKKNQIYDSLYKFNSFLIENESKKKQINKNKKEVTTSTEQ